MSACVAVGFSLGLRIQNSLAKVRQVDDYANVLDNELVADIVDMLFGFMIAKMLKSALILTQTNFTN
ncbi:uncharacterized protein PHALS_15485 [Plasmopara halstedii]|uniref:Uncharacterized protein n=1 Tax=Plasmopara halstedii TaxID=4781 RepID=A0A0P1AJG5_PLAHL|nr:uncharacterized protein PHALS_15485 [Plasmopara halstedii]CEG41097.1 hypothetical protein PHALS_15485 [Plasmopara halstedii]|eukprot:XP_024577466.1 hypothetical protein PHALS_15485 [Plasmopara halstedii]